MKKERDTTQGVDLGEEKAKVIRIQKVKDCAKAGLWAAAQLAPNDMESWELISQTSW